MKMIHLLKWNMVKWGGFLFCLALHLPTYSQQAAIDSLEARLEAPGLSTEDRIQVLHRLMNAFPYERLDTAIIIGQLALDLADSSNKAKEKGEILSDIGRLYITKRDHQSALEYYESALVVFESIGSEENKCKVLSRIGVANFFRDDLPAALDYYYRSLKIAERINSESMISSLNTNLGIIWGDLEEFQKADSCYKTALKIFVAKKQWQYCLNVAVNRSINYRYWGKYEQAIDLADTLTFFAEKVGSKYGYGIAAYTEGFALIKSSDVHLGIKKMRQARGYFKELNANYEYLCTLADEAQGFIALKRFSDARDQIVQVIEEIELEEDSELAYEAYATLTEAYLELGECEKVPHTLEMKAHWEEKALDEQKRKHLTLLQIEYETEKKEQEIKNLTQQAEIQSLRLSKKNNQIILGGSGVLLVFIISILLYRQQYTKKQRLSVELEQRFLRSQLNPHFVFNSMAAIQNFLLQSDGEKASDYMGVFGTLMRQILENSRCDFISLKEEISMLHRYLDLQKLRFTKNLTYKIVIDDRLNPQYSGVPPMFAQPFIENALEHGLFRKDAETNSVEVHFLYVDEQNIRLEVVDNGVGHSAEESVTAHHSLATKINKERLQAFGKGTFNAENLKNEQLDVIGYKVSLCLPTRLVTARAL